MSDKGLLSQTSRTLVPQEFKEIHRDLWVVCNPNILSAPLKSAFLIMFVPPLIMFVVYLVEQNWTSALSYGAAVVVMLLVGFAVYHATRVNREECWYASWILKNIKPIETDAEIFQSRKYWRGRQ